MNSIPKKKLDNLIPKAIRIIDSSGFKDNNGKIAKTFQGYFSSFGADMINTSPLAASIFSEDSSKRETESNPGTKEDRSLVTKAILKLLQEQDNSITSEKLSEYIISQSDNGVLNTRSLNNILVAATALKIALRTFKKS